MEITRNHSLYLQIDNESDVGVCRRKAVALAREMGFDEVKSGEVAILVTELVTNVLKHGGGRGKILICQIKNKEEQKALEIWCCDYGKGINQPEKSIADGFTKANTLGFGLGTILRFSDEFEINPKERPEMGDSGLNGFEGFTHCIRTLKWVPAKKWSCTNRNLQIGAATRSKPGEKLNGDTYVVTHLSGSKTVAAVIDGLGHGKDAHLASNKLKEQLLLKADLPLNSLMNHIHKSIRGTRGAVIGLLSIDTDAQKLNFTGIGNIETFLLSSEGKKNLLSFGGIIGHNMRTPRVFEHEMKPGNTIFMYSDGITSRWTNRDFEREMQPQQKAEFILNNYSRQNDDATILIIRYIA